MSYVPPHNRNNETTERKNTFQRGQHGHSHRNSYRDVGKEQAEAAAAEKIKQQERDMANTEENFPILGDCASPRVWNGKKFTDLAAEWKEADEIEKHSNAEKEASEEYNFVLPKFRTVHRFAEPEDDPPVEKSVDEWEVVQRKPRKVKRDLTEEELEAKYAVPEDDENTDTVWGGQEEHQTCWNERRF
jgi:hypothetical protein